LEITMTTTLRQIPGYVVGTWDIDAAHSTVGFSVRHMMVSKVRGYFREFSGEIVTAEDPTQSSVTAQINMDSIDTRQEQRDAHIRSADFFDVGNHTEMTFRSTRSAPTVPTGASSAT
jgi:polyisoprenoid-binding protein YceI